LNNDSDPSIPRPLPDVPASLIVAGVDLEPLLRVDRPRFHLLSSPASVLVNFERGMLDGGMTVRVLQSAIMRTSDGLFDEISRALEFPSYFGRNWAALDECLADLEWLPGLAYVLAFADASSLLVSEPGRFSVLLNLLDRVGQERSQPVSVGEPWDRPAVPFHVIFHTTPDATASLQSRLLNGGAEFDVLDARSDGA
jgi:RNAse (barnase) inhibitor barstar